MEMETEISLNHLYQLLKKNIIFIIILAVLGGGIALGYTKLMVKEKYTTAVKLYVYVPNAQATSTVNMTDISTAQKVVKTHIQLLNTVQFFNDVIDTSELKYSASQLKNMVTFSILDATEVFQVSVVTGAPEESKLIADTIAKIAPETIASFQENATLKIVDAALLPSTPSSPNVSMNIIIGVLLGIGGSAFFVLLKDFLDVTVKSEDDIIEKYNIPVLACIPDFDDGVSGKL
jgi:capsular polysaccharide biosynthesis protein